MKEKFLSAITTAMNSYLALDPESKARINKLQGKAIAIELLPFHFTFQCEFKENTVKIHNNELIETETQIRGTPFQMLGVMIAKDNRQQFFADDLVMEGNAEVGQLVIALFDELQIDWEEHMSQVIGDVPAYHVGRFMRTVSGWLRNTEKTVTQDISEYVHEETRLFPASEALQDFYNDIDVLRMDVDRVDARIRKLRESLMS